MADVQRQAQQEADEAGDAQHHAEIEVARQGAEVAFDVLPQTV